MHAQSLKNQIDKLFARPNVNIANLLTHFTNSIRPVVANPEHSI